MKIAIFGATGGTGSELMNQALGQRYEVTAIVRRPEAITRRDANLTVVAGDALNPNSFADTLRGHDAVVSTLGVSSFIKSLKPMTFHHDAAVNIVKSMQAQNVHRLVCLTSVGVHKNPKALFTIARSSIPSCRTSMKTCNTWRKSCEIVVLLGPSCAR